MASPLSQSKTRLLWIGGRGGEGGWLSKGLESHFDLRYADDFVPSDPDRLPVSDVLSRVAETGFEPSIYYFWSPTITGNYTGWEALPSNSMVHLIDSHYAFPWQAELAPLFRATILEVRTAASYFWRNAPDSLQWCPPCFHGTAEEVRRHPPFAERPLDVAFVGSMNPQAMPHRVDFMRRLGDRLHNRCRLHLGRCSGPVGEIYSKAKIVINFTTRPAWAFVPDPLNLQPHAAGLNGRVFDAMGHGAMLLADSPASDLHQMFREGEHFAFYRFNNVEDAADEILYYLEHEEERLALAFAGWQCIQEQHTYPIRAAHLASLIHGTLDGMRDSEIGPGGRRFLLARSLLNMVLQTADSLEGPMKRNFDEKLGQARSLLASECGRDNEPIRRSLVPLLDAIEGQPGAALPRWFEVWNRHRCPVAALFLEVALRWMGQGRRADEMADWQAGAARDGTVVSAQEQRALADMLCIVFQNFPRGVARGMGRSPDLAAAIPQDGSGLSISP